jgi:predicted component of type VI protein secretion system
VSELATTVREAPIAETAALPLREEVLAGAFFGFRHPIAAERVAGFRYLPTADALAAWFGTAVAVNLAADLDSCRAALDRDIAAIDALLGEQLDAVLHQPRLRRFEGRWRGLAWLAGGVEPAGPVKLKVLNLSWAELCRDL